MPANVAVSACFLGRPCRYDGSARPCREVIALGKTCKLVPICPEIEGGLPTPRRPCEIDLSKRDLFIGDADGADRTEAFLIGARKAFEVARKEECSLAILKAKSPSCGSGQVYDGTFSGTLAAGYGVAARLFRFEGVRVMDECLLKEALAASEALHPGAIPPILAASSAECPVLETERLFLRPLTVHDAEDAFAYCSDPDVGSDAGWAPHRTMEDARVFVEQIASAPHVFGVFEKVKAVEGTICATGPCIGSIGLVPDPRRHNPDCLVLGYALAKWAWGRGYATEAAREVMRYGFEELRIALMSCAHYSFSNRSRRVIEKCGFKYEGILHAAEAFPDGVVRDMCLYYLDAEEWRAQPHPLSRSLRRGE